MKREMEKLYESITNLDEALIEQASSPRRKSYWVRWTAMAACLALMIGTVTMLRQHDDMEAQAPMDAPYMSYAGPLLPLTLREPVEGLTADRTIQYDFSQGNALVRDAYVLQNTTEEALNLTLYAPFAGDFKTKNWPSITLDGAEQPWELLAGDYAGIFTGAGDEVSASLNLLQPRTWEDYDALLTDGAYFEAIFSPAPDLSQPVTVYELRDITDSGSGLHAATLCMTLDYDEGQTDFLTFGFNGAGGNQFSLFIRYAMRRPDEVVRLIVLGEDVRSYSLQGYEDGGCEPGEELEGCTATVVRREMTLGEAVEDVARIRYKAIHQADYDGDDNRYLGEAVTFEQYRRAIFRFLAAYGPGGTDPKERYQWGRLDDIIYETATHERILYAAFPVTIPAGGSVEILVEREQEASFDFFTGENTRKTQGFDLVTTLGSDLDFTAVTVSVTGLVTLIDQNLGLSPTGGIASLDLTQPHYYLDMEQP